ncbi:MAG: hypothetical protein HEQ12_16085 [Aphanizomenon flos-aquae DEX188]|nr:MAG: hypothetical protein HEQ12_16085 [Aphanizomenon flos-aquae DEX188]
MRSHSLNLLTANCLQQRFAIAPLQLPQTSFFNEPQRHRGHREREIAPPQPPKQRSHPLNSPNSDRTPLTPKQRSHSLNIPNSDRTPSTSQTAIAPPQPPKQRSHPFNFPNSDRIPSTSQHPFLMNHEDTKNAKEEEKKERSQTLPKVYPQYYVTK